MKKLILLILTIIVGLLLIGCSEEISTNTPEMTTNTLQNNSITNNASNTNYEVTTLNTTEDNASENISETIDTANTDSTNSNNNTKSSGSFENPTSPNIDACKSEINERCTGPPWFDCVGDATMDASKKTLSFTVKNTLNRSIRLTSFATYNTEDDPWPCMTRLVVDNTSVNVGGEFIDINQMPIIQVDDSFQIILTYSGTEKGYISQGFELSYDYLDNMESSSSYFRIEATP